MIKRGKYKGNVVNDLRFIIMDKIAINNEIVSAGSALCVNCAHAQERVVSTMWGMALARSLGWSIPVNSFSILGF